MRSVLWAIMACGLLLPGQFASAMSSPPNFAGAGMAPNDVDIVVGLSSSEGDGHWARHFEDVASDSLGVDAVAEWRNLRSFLRSIVGKDAEGEGPLSHLFIRFADSGANADWVYAVELLDRVKCERGFRDAGAILKGGGGFLLSQGNIEVHVSGKWLVAGALGSRLREDVSRLAAIDVNVSDDARVLEVIQGMPQSPIEIIVRHESPTGGCTAAAITELSPGIAEVLVNGTYDASPLPTRSPGDLDVRLISDGDDHASIVMYESGIGILDPILLDLGVSIPGLLPPAEVRKGLELQRLLVLEKAAIEAGFQPPAVCLAVPFKPASEKERKHVEIAINEWMAKVTRLFFIDSEDDVDSSVGTIPLQAGVLNGIRKHPMARGASLNWAVSNGALSQPWFIAGTTPDSVRRLRERLAGFSRDESDREAVASRGMVHARHLAEVIKTFAEIRKENVGPNSQSDYRVFNVMIDMVTRFKNVKWNFNRQDPQQISGRLELSITDSISSSGRVVNP